VTDLPEPELFKVTAYLLQANLVSLQEILPHVRCPLDLIRWNCSLLIFIIFRGCKKFQLTPSDGDIEATFTEMTKEATVKAKKLGVVSLAVCFVSFFFSFFRSKQTRFASVSS